MKHAALIRSGAVTYSKIRAEGPLEVGRVERSMVLFVRTQRGVRLFHADLLPDRHLDEYGIQLATIWLEDGHTAFETAANLGISMPHLANELAAAGYERMSLEDLGKRKGAAGRIRAKKRDRAMKRGRTLRRTREAVANGFHFDRTVST